jgi:hypothetical protein
MMKMKSNEPLMHFITSIFLSLSYLLIYPMYQAAITTGPNSTLGYRTARSLSSQYAWEFANNLAAQYSVRFSVGLTLLTLAAAALLYFRGIRSVKVWRGLSFGVIGAWMVGTFVIIALVETQLAAL